MSTNCGEIIELVEYSGPKHPYSEGKLNYYTQKTIMEKTKQYLCWCKSRPYDK